MTVLRPPSDVARRGAGARAWHGPMQAYTRDDVRITKSSSSVAVPRVHGRCAALCGGGPVLAPLRDRLHADAVLSTPVTQWLAAFGMNEVNARRARLVLRWVTVFGRVFHFGM